MSMGLYIKNMEMPKDCDSCQHPTCELWLDTDVGKRHPNCPIIEVHEPHGDLVERKAVLDTFRDHMSVTRHFVTIRDEIPTVIPASEEG